MNAYDLLKPHIASWLLATDASGAAQLVCILRDVIGFHTGEGDLLGRHPQRYYQLCRKLQASAIPGPPIQDGDMAIFAELGRNFDLLEDLRFPVYQITSLTNMPVEIVSLVMNLLSNSDLAKVQTLCKYVQAACDSLPRKEFRFVFDAKRRVHAGPLFRQFAVTRPFWTSAWRPSPAPFTYQLHELCFRAGQLQNHRSFRLQVTHAYVRDRLPSPWAAMFICFESTLLGHALRPLLTDFLRLRSLTLDGVYVSRSVFSALAGSVLESLTLEACLVFEFISTSTTPPTLGLESLCIRGDSSRVADVRGLWNVLRACTGLRTLLICPVARSSPFPITPIEADEIHLLALRVLVVTVCDRKTIPAFFKWLGLSAPCLQRIYLDTRLVSPDWVYVKNLLQPWKGTLTTLCIGQLVRLERNSGRELCLEFPTLRQLSCALGEPDEAGMLSFLAGVRNLTMFRSNWVPSNPVTAKDAMMRMLATCSSLRKVAFGDAFDGDSYRGYVPHNGLVVEHVAVDNEITARYIKEDDIWCRVVGMNRDGHFSLTECSSMRDASTVFATAELWDEIWKHIDDPVTLIRRLSKSWRCHLARTLRHHYNLDRFLKRYFPEEETRRRFRELMAIYGVIISGSQALDFLGHYGFAADSDTDVYVGLDGLVAVGTFFTQHGFEYCSENGWSADVLLHSENNSTVYPSTGIVHVFKFKGPRDIDLVLVADCPMSAVLHFHFTIVMNGLTWNHAFSAYPAATFKYRKGLVLHGSDAALSKYRSRGFRLEDNRFGLAGSAFSGCLPTNVRSFGDGHTWTLDFETSDLNIAHSPQSISAHCFALSSLPYASAPGTLVISAFSMLAMPLSHPLLQHVYVLHPACRSFAVDALDWMERHSRASTTPSSWRFSLGYYPQRVLTWDMVMPFLVHAWMKGRPLFLMRGRRTWKFVP